MQLLDDQTIVAKLKQYRVYVTRTRIAVLKILLQQKGAVSVHHIRKVSADLDRVSVYRSLSLFLKKGLIITLPGITGYPQYLMSDFLEQDNVGNDHSQRVYFICRRCGHAELVRQPVILSIQKPGYYEINNCNIILEGKCSGCK